MPSPSEKPGWFRLREPLTPGRAGVLTLCSFLLPVVLWCIVSYVPFIWHPDIKLEISADRTGIATTYTDGDHLSREFFPEFVASVRDENRQAAAAREAGTESDLTPREIRRANQKVLRQIAPLAVRQHWINDSQREDDEAIYQIWAKMASGELNATRPVLTEENLAIVRDNWTRLSALSAEFDSAALPDTPLQQLVPQGHPANPVYLPAPHEVIRTGWDDFTAPAEGDRQTMAQRLGHSIRIVFTGFLLSCLIGIPLGIFCGCYSFISRLCEPFIDFFRYMPAPAFSTLLVAILEAHDAPKIALVFIGTVFQMILVVGNTTRLLDRSLLEAAQTLGARPRQIVRSVVIPGILPNLYNDLRILLGWSWTWLVIAELIGVKSGLTEFIETQGRFRNFDRVFPVIILIGVTGFVTDQILSWLHGLLFPWAGKSGPLSRSIARIATWPLRTIAAGARDRMATMGPPAPRS